MVRSVVDWADRARAEFHVKKDKTVVMCCGEGAPTVEEYKRDPVYFPGVNGGPPRPVTMAWKKKPKSTTGATAGMENGRSHAGDVSRKTPCTAVHEPMRLLYARPGSSPGLGHANRPRCGRGMSLHPRCLP